MICLLRNYKFSLIQALHYWQSVGTRHDGKRSIYGDDCCQSIHEGYYDKIKKQNKRGMWVLFFFPQAH